MSKAPASKLWLVKVPKHLLETWKKQGPGASLGIIEAAHASAGPSGRQEFTLRMPADAASSGAPMEYALSLSAPPGAMYSYLPGPPDGEMRLEGKIDLKGDLQATELTSSYKQLVRGRQDTAGVRPELQAISQAEDLELGGVTQRLQKQGELHKQAREVKKRKADKVERKAKEAKLQKKFTKEELRDLVFEKFEKQRYWHKIDLANTLGQKPTDLGPILDEVCERVKFGVHKQEYQLKTQFGGGGAAV